MKKSSVLITIKQKRYGTKKMTAVMYSTCMPCFCQMYLYLYLYEYRNLVLYSSGGS